MCASTAAASDDGGVAVEDPHSRDIAVALSGGGHRATVFGLGALLAICDYGLNNRIGAISSVSGGSIANGIVMTGRDFGTVTAPEFEANISSALYAIADRGVLLRGAPATRWYIRRLLALAGLTVVSFIAFVVGAFTGSESSPCCPWWS